MINHWTINPIDSPSSCSPMIPHPPSEQPGRRCSVPPLCASHFEGKPASRLMGPEMLGLMMGLTIN